MAITLTDSAAQHVKHYLAKRGKGLGVRLAVRTSGCSGLAYVIEYADQAEVQDCIFEDKGITLVVDPKSMVYLEGTELDFGKEGLNEGFSFKNPNETGRCGCGESFNV